jgi:hypothetical protein
VEDPAEAAEEPAAAPETTTARSDTDRRMATTVEISNARARFVMMASYFKRA